MKRSDIYTIIKQCKRILYTVVVIYFIVRKGLILYLSMVANKKFVLI